MTKPSKPKSWRDILPIHPAAELFPIMTADELKALGEDIKKNGLREGVSMFDGAVLDGRNRLAAMEAVGIKLVTGNGQIEWATIQCRNVGRVDPVVFVISKNIHRRHLTAEQKRDLIAKLVTAAPEKSNRQIAEMAKVDHKTVASVRAKQEATGEVPQLAKTIGKDGKARKSPAKPAKSHKPATEADVAVIAAADRAEARLEEIKRASVSEVETSTTPRTALQLKWSVTRFTKQIHSIVVAIMQEMETVEWPRLIAALREEINSIERASRPVNERTEETVAAASRELRAAPSSEPRKDDLGIPDFLRRTAP